ncbi:lantibiotic dehydratase C-terminal domain-containing protein [Longimicrobium sp.]|jgi:hypothetical protein|uniref:lantibiotic dehydratase C-terminal domain-containing protein n=1 Tax=Longimicrobium sp. TaxID=2029185 RepID=UPI002ED8F2CD
MGTQPGPGRPADGGWHGFHLVYHADRDALLTGVVAPLVGELWQEGVLRRCFFVRYHLGGPHVRLRLELPSGAGTVVTERVRARTEEFFRLYPSTAPRPAEEIRRENRGILAGDALAVEREDLVYPDNSVQDAPVVFETERYGGPALLEHSLDFFTVSSARALSWLHVSAGQPAGARLAGAARLLVRQAWGLAPDGAAFTELAGSGVRLMGEVLPAFVARGDEAFERGGGSMERLVRHELDALSAGDAGPDVLAAAALAGAIAGADEFRRWSIAASQLHMTANRLGLLNPQEVYLARMLWRAAEAAAAADPVWWRACWEARARWCPGVGAPLRRMALDSPGTLAGGTAPTASAGT